MALVKENAVTKGLSGMLGGQLLFKVVGGRTVVCKAPARPRVQSEKQRVNREKFRRASSWARQQLSNPDRLLYYRTLARQHQLPNAYTAAVAKYMKREEIRNPLQCSRLITSHNPSSSLINSLAPEGPAIVSHVNPSSLPAMAKPKLKKLQH